MANSESRKSHSGSSPRTFRRALGVVLAFALVGLTGCYKNEENRKEEKYEQKKQESEPAEAAEKDEEADKAKPEAEDVPEVQSSLEAFSRAVSEAAQDANGAFFKENMAAPEFFEGCKATGNAAVDSLSPEELKKRYTETDRVAAMESAEEDLGRYESEKLVKVFTDLEQPAKFHGTLEAAGDDARCAIEASAKVETAAMIDHEDDDIVRHVTDLLYDGKNWRVVGLESVAVDCDKKPMAKTRACKEFQSMEM